MLKLLADFSPYFTLLNVFRYITFRTAGATATALLFVFMFGPAIIDTLRLKQGKGQPIRDDGPKSHLITQERHAHDGRADDPLGPLRRHLALGRSAQPLRLDRARRDLRLRGGRLLRRFPQGDEAVA